MIGDHLVERKRLIQVERKGLKKGIKVTHQVKSIIWINHSRYFKWVSRMILGERSLLPNVGACRLCVGKPSVVLGRLTWKWWSEEHLKCLVEAIKRVDQEKQATPKKELVIAIQVVFQIVSHASIDQRIKASQPHHDSALDHISDSQFIWVKNRLYLWLLVFTKLIIGPHMLLE